MQQVVLAYGLLLLDCMYIQDGLLIQDHKTNVEIIIGA